MPRAQKKPVADTNQVRVQDRGGFNLDTVVQGGPEIQVINGGKDFQKLVEEEGFMHEKLSIRFHETADPNAPKLVEVGVGIEGRDVRRAFERGKIYNDVPRFLVEVLAHAKVTDLRQKQGPSGRPDDIVNVEKHAFYYPFEVLHDPNPKGRAWLEKVLADPA